MALGNCVVPVGDPGIPDPIYELNGLTVQLDSDGTATMSITIISKSSTPITSPAVKYGLGSQEFCGYVEESSPRRLEGSEWVEHSVLMRGWLGEGGNCGSSGPTVDLSGCG